MKFIYNSRISVFVSSTTSKTLKLINLAETEAKSNICDIRYQSNKITSNLNESTPDKALITQCPYSAAAYLFPLLHIAYWIKLIQYSHSPRPVQIRKNSFRSNRSCTLRTLTQSNCGGASLSKNRARESKD